MKNHSVLAVPLLLWAGLAIGGNLIAAPAKFDVDVLSLGDLLRVGRAQFAWLGSAEIFFAVLTVVICLFITGWPRRAAAIAVFILALQQLGFQPILQDRTDMILTGQTPPETHLHLWFIGAEVAKVALLILGSVSLTCDTNISRHA